METARMMLLLTSTLAILAGATSASKTLFLWGGWIVKEDAIMWNKAVSLAGGRDVARIGFLTAAASQPISQSLIYKERFEMYGAAEAYWIPIHKDNTSAAMDKEVVKNIQRMTGFFFVGGTWTLYKQNLLMKDGQPTPAFAAIREMYENGIPVIGSSAGAECMTDVYGIVGGSSYGALKSGAIKKGDSTGSREDLVYEPEAGFSFFSGHMIDVHFHEQGRQGRLIRLLSDTRKMAHGTDYGIGIDEATGILITNVGTAQEKGEVYGKGGVFYVDVSKSIVDTASTNWHILNVFCHYVTAGDFINMKDHSITFGPRKRPLKGNETMDYAITSNDIFHKEWIGSISEFRGVAQSLFLSRFDSVTSGLTKERTVPFRVIFVDDSQSVGYAEVDNKVVKVSYTNLKMEIRPQE